LLEMDQPALAWAVTPVLECGDGNGITVLAHGSFHESRQQLIPTQAMMHGHRV
jgi:hypothetical protein